MEPLFCNSTESRSAGLSSEPKLVENEKRIMGVGVPVEYVDHFFFACFAGDPDDVIIESDQMKLVIAKDGMSKSLLFKPTNEECLMPGVKTPISTLTQERPYQNEIKLAYPTKETTFKANSVRREGDQLIIGYELIPWEAVVTFKITPQYIRFGLKDFNLKVKNYGIKMTEPPVSEMWFLQLPVRNRTHFGDWLNVIWDNRQAVNLLGTDPSAKIDAEEREGYHLLVIASI